jgi:hypothetical protein
MRARLSLSATLLASVVAVTGCSGGSSQATSGGSSGSVRSSAASPTPTTSATPTPRTSSTSASASASSPSTLAHGQPTDLPRDQTAAASYHVAVLASSDASTPEEHAAVAAWMTFWQAAADTYYYDRPVPALDRTAMPSVRSSIVDYMEKKKRQHERVVGWARDNVLAVNVAGDLATIHDCTENYTFSIDQSGDPLTRPTPYYDVTGKLQKVDGQWKVAEQHSDDRSLSCLS